MHSLKTIFIFKQKFKKSPEYNGFRNKYFGIDFEKIEILKIILYVWPRLRIQLLEIKLPYKLSYRLCLGPSVGLLVCHDFKFSLPILILSKPLFTNTWKQFFAAFETEFVYSQRAENVLFIFFSEKFNLIFLQCRKCLATNYYSIRTSVRSL